MYLPATIYGSFLGFGNIEILTMLRGIAPFLEGAYFAQAILLSFLGNGRCSVSFCRPC
jgi:hypothetical protein